jgi:hypothetical protein
VTKYTSPSNQSPQLIPIESIERRIFLIRGHKVMLDRDLAELYGVTTKRLNEQVKRNRGRFPEDFMFQLSLEEGKSILALRSQFATLKRGWHLKYAPYAFTEHGVAMLSSVLNSQRAVQMNILIIRAFVALREMLATHKDLARKIEEQWCQTTVFPWAWGHGSLTPFFSPKNASTLLARRSGCTRVRPCPAPGMISALT